MSQIVHGFRSAFRHLLIGLAVTAGVAAAAVPLRAETLGDALVGAYRSSNLLEQNRALLRAADENVASAVSALRPVVNFVASQSRTDTGGIVTHSGSLALQASMTLYDFGRNGLGVDVQKETVLATRAALVNIEQTVLENAVIAFTSVRSAAQTVALRQNNVRVITEQLRAAQDRFEVGEVTRTDVALAEARLAEARSNLVAAQGALASARELYKLVVGRYPDQLLPPPAGPQTAATLEEARAIAVRRHPTIEQAQHIVAARDLAAEAAKRGVLPTISGSASASHSLTTGTNSNQLSITLTQPLYAGGRISAGYRAAVANAEAARADLRQQVLLVEQAVANAWVDIQVARSSLESSDRQIRSARVAFDSVSEEAALGARTTLDVLDAEQDLLNAQSARINAEAQLTNSVYGLLSAMGLLTVEHLNLGIPTYDPSVYYNAVQNAPATSTQGRRLDRVLNSIGRN